MQVILLQRHKCFSSKNWYCYNIDIGCMFFKGPMTSQRIVRLLLSSFLMGGRFFDIFLAVDRTSFPYSYFYTLNFPPYFDRLFSYKQLKTWKTLTHRLLRIYCSSSVGGHDLCFWYPLICLIFLCKTGELVKLILLISSLEDPVPILFDFQRKATK